MDKKIVVSGLNAYGYKFELPAIELENYAISNKHNNRFFVVVQIKTVDRNGNAENKTISFQSKTNESQLDSSKLYWEKLTYEDGTVLENSYAKELENAAQITKLNYEFIHKLKFTDDYNKYVAHPVICTNGRNLNQNGLLLAIVPTKDKGNSARVAILDAGVFYFKFNENAKIKIYEDNGKTIKQIDEISGMEKESQPGDE